VEAAHRRDCRPAGAPDREPEFRLAEAAADCPAERLARALGAWEPAARHQVFPMRKSFRYAAFADDELRERILGQRVPEKTSGCLKPEKPRPRYWPSSALRLAIRHAATGKPEWLPQVVACHVSGGPVIRRQRHNKATVAG